MKQKSAFTLAEVMIVLVVIGVLSAILIPTAIKSKPDEAKMKFENTLSSIATTTREVVSSDEYFLDGDMSKKINGTSSTSINVCSAFANTLNFKTSNCNNTNSTTDTSNPDEDCANSSNKAQITTKNGVEYFFSSNTPFTNENSQKTICFDIDGIGKGEAPFGLKLRADGKITYGTRALTWSGSTPESINNSSETNVPEIPEIEIPDGATYICCCPEIFYMGSNCDGDSYVSETTSSDIWDGPQNYCNTYDWIGSCVANPYKSHPIVGKYNSKKVTGCYPCDIY